MRLTFRLYAGIRDVTVRNWNKVWRNRGKFYDYPVQIPQPLLDKETEIVDMSNQAPKLQSWTPPVPDDPRWAKPIPPEEQPDWKDEPSFMHKGDVRLFEGVKQACLIAKAQHFESFPPCVDQLIGAVETSHRDLLLQRAIMQSQVWNTDQDKLPKPPKDPRKPIWKWTRKFGITRQKSSLILLRNLLRMGQSHITDFPSLNSRKQIIDLPFYSYVIYRDKPIVMQETLDVLLTSDQMLAPFGDESVVDASVMHKIPDMWPVFPTVDFLETNNYELLSDTGFRKEGQFTCPHTLIQVPRKTHWESQHYQASQVMTCLQYTAALARNKFGEDVRILPEPICVQHVMVEQSRLFFAFFQLNTLDLSSDTGIKNLVWTGPVSHLFEKIMGQPWMSRPLKFDKLVNYDPEAYENFLAVYLCGLPELQAGSRAEDQS